MVGPVDNFNAAEPSVVLDSLAALRIASDFEGWERLFDVIQRIGPDIILADFQVNPVVIPLNIQGA